MQVIYVHDKHSKRYISYLDSLKECNDARASWKFIVDNMYSCSDKRFNEFKDSLELLPIRTKQFEKLKYKQIIVLKRIIKISEYKEVEYRIFVSDIPPPKIGVIYQPPISIVHHSPKHRNTPLYPAESLPKHFQIEWYRNGHFDSVKKYVVKYIK